MIRILEIAWLVITLVTAVVAVVRLFQDGIETALGMFIVSAVAFSMFMIRRKQRIRMGEQMEKQQDEATRYH